MAAAASMWYMNSTTTEPWSHVVQPTAIVLLLLFFTLPAGAQTMPAEISEADRQAIRMVIEEQLGAFQRDDAAAAFAQASPNIQAMFQTPDRFMDMVRGGYRPVYRPRRVEFRDIINIDGVPTQRVFIIGPDGAPVMALYPMEQQADGVWKIGGCYLVPAADGLA